jgi:hypothetical protein
VSLELAAPGGLKRLMGRRGERRITFSAREISVEHGDLLRAPLRFAPGAVLVAAVDPGPAEVGREGRRGRFPILHRLGPSQVVPAGEGIEGWLWTSEDGTAFTLLGDGAPNLAMVFSPPCSRGSPGPGPSPTARCRRPSAATCPTTSRRTRP